MGNPERGFQRFPGKIPPPGTSLLFLHRPWRAYPTAKSPLCTMHPPRDTGPVSYHVSQNKPGASRALAFVALQPAPPLRPIDACECGCQADMLRVGRSSPISVTYHLNPKPCAREPFDISISAYATHPPRGMGPASRRAST